MKLYHLSFNLDDPLTKTFYPRVPKTTIDGENHSIPRICLSHNILGCINALPEFEKRFLSTWDETKECASAILYSVDIQDIFPSQLIDSTELYERGLVPDAIINQECWYGETITMTGREVGLLEVSNRVRVMHCAKEQNRDFIYSVIDRFTDGFASRNAEKLNELSLFYIMNYLFNTSEMDSLFDGVSADLDFEFSKIANNRETTHLVDYFIVYPDFFVNDELISLWPDGLKYKDFTPFSAVPVEDKPTLDEILEDANARITPARSHGDIHAELER